MPVDAYIPIHTNGGSLEQTPLKKLNDNLDIMYNAMFKIQTVSASHNALSGEMVRMTTGATGKNVTLPTPTAGETIVVFVEKVDNGVGAVTVLGTINGVTNDTLSAQYDTQKYISINGGNYIKWK